MKIIPLITEEWKMDGGVAFGVVPKSIWQKIYPADENNLLTIVNRCLLLIANDKKILINAGFGNKRDEKYYQYKYITKQNSLKNLLESINLTINDITDVIFTHLHDDHCGGATIKSETNNSLHPLFPNANYYVSKKQWEWALSPNSREKASYFNDNLIPLQETNRLHLLEINEQPFEYLGISLLYFDGHTAGQIIPVITTNDKTFVYVSDFIASSAHIPLPYIPAVDIQPLMTLQEKEKFLEKAVEKNYYLIFEHDSMVECCNVKKTEKGYAMNEKFSLTSIL